MVARYVRVESNDLEVEELHLGCGRTSAEPISEVRAIY